MARPSSTDDGRQTEPHRAIDPDSRLTLHGELTGDDLVAAVFADPASDGPRLVYGDYLLERGDPRGELIQLQLQRHASGEPAGQREQDLLAMYVKEWTEPLWHGLERSSIRFERGFLHACRTDGTLALRDAIGHPMWSTVERLESDELALVVSPCMRSMRTLRTRLPQLRRLCHVAHAVPVERVELHPRYDFTLQSPWEDVLKVGALTSLRELSIELDEPHPTSRPVAELLDSRLGGQLERLELRGHAPLPLHLWESVVREHRSIRAIGSSIQARLDDRESPVTLLERGADGQTTVVLELTSARVPSDDTLHVLQSFAQTRHGTLEIRYRPGDPEVDSAALDAIRRRVTPAFREISATPNPLRRR